ncbi:MAG: hypothetical protein QM737_02850 [Ferruginibacter sp.]
MKTEDDYLSAIYNLKWEKGFKCRNCKSKAVPYDRPNYGVKCKACGKEESVLANTMFEGSRLPIHKWFQLINSVQETLHEYFLVKYHIKSLQQLKDSDFFLSSVVKVGKELFFRVELWEVPATTTVYKRRKDDIIDGEFEIDRTVEVYCRESLAELSKDLGIAENTISKVFERIYEWMPKKARTWMDVFPEWKKGLTDKRSIAVYEALFHLVFTSSQTTVFDFPDEDRILRMAVLKELYDER